MSDKSKATARGWAVVGLLWVVGCLNYLDRVMITTMRDSLKETIPMTDAQFGLLTSVFLWVYGGLSPLAGFLSDRFGRSRVIIGSLLTWSVLTWLTGAVNSFPALVAVRALMGLSEACYLPAALALIADYHRGSTRSLATGLHLSGTMAGAGLGGVGGWLAERHGWSYAFNLFGFLGIAYAALLLFSLRDPPPRETVDGSAGSSTVRFLDALRSLFAQRGYILALVYWGTFGLVGWVVVGWMPTYLNEHFHLGQGVAGLTATGYLQVSGIIGVISGGALADWWSRTNPRGRFYVPMIGLCLAAPGILLAAGAGTMGFAIAGLIVYGLGRCFPDANMMPILCLLTDARYRATAYGLINCCACFAGGAAIYAGGALRDMQAAGLSQIFQAASACLIVCVGLLLLISRSDRVARADADRSQPGA